MASGSVLQTSEEQNLLGASRLYQDICKESPDDAGQRWRIHAFRSILPLSRHQLSINWWRWAAMKTSCFSVSLEISVWSVITFFWFCLEETKEALLFHPLDKSAQLFFWEVLGTTGLPSGLWLVRVKSGPWWASRRSAGLAIGYQPVGW